MHQGRQRRVPDVCGRAGGYIRIFWTDEDWAWKESRQLQFPILQATEFGWFPLRAAFEGKFRCRSFWPVSQPGRSAPMFAISTLGPIARPDSRAKPALRPYASAPLHKDAAESPDSCRPIRGLASKRFRFTTETLAVCAMISVRSRPSARTVSWGVSGTAIIEWTQTPFRPLPGFAIDPRYPGYSQAFSTTKHS